MERHTLYMSLALKMDHPRGMEPHHGTCSDATLTLTFRREMEHQASGQTPVVGR
jgi:hypothetical protein